MEQDYRQTMAYADEVSARAAATCDAANRMLSNFREQAVTTPPKAPPLIPFPKLPPLIPPDTLARMFPAERQEYFHAANPDNYQLTQHGMQGQTAEPGLIASLSAPEPTSSRSALQVHQRRDYRLVGSMDCTRCASSGFVRGRERKQLLDCPRCNGLGIVPVFLV